MYSNLTIPKPNTPDFSNVHIRTVKDDDGKIWFVARDICAALNLKNNRQAVSTVPASEKKLYKDPENSSSQTMTIISELGLLVFINRRQGILAKSLYDWMLSTYCNPEPLEKLLNKPMEREKDDRRTILHSLRKRSISLPIGN